MLIKIDERTEYKLICLTYVPTTSQPIAIFTIWSFFNPLSLFAPHVVTLSRPPTMYSLNITDRSLNTDIHHLVFGINFQIHSVILASLVSIHLFIHSPTHLCHHHHSLHPLLLHSFIPASEPNFSTNPSHLIRLLVAPGLPSLIVVGLLELTYHAHRFIFSSFFV